MNILDRANKIVNERNEESMRNYGPFSESMDRTAEMYNLMSGREFKLTGEDVLKVLIALKLSRENYAHKEDSLLDAAAYIGALNNYHIEKTSNLNNNNNAKI